MPWELNKIMGKGRDIYRYIDCYFHIHVARVIILSPGINKKSLKEL